MIFRWAVMGVVASFLVVGFQAVPNQAWAKAADKDWVSKVISVQGRVQVKRQGETDWQKVRLNDALFTGDQIRVEAKSRAGIVLRNDSVVRLDQNTTLVFTQIKDETTFIFRLLKGAANFFSHQPRSLEVVTPFVNGVVEGTEFYVQVDAEQTRIELFEGRILARNPYGKVLLAKGEGAVAAAGNAPRKQLLVRPRDSVQWALYYPPVLAMGSDAPSAEFEKYAALFNQSRTSEAIAGLNQIPKQEQDARFFAYRAALLLHVGRVAEARDDIQQALAQDSNSSAALALQTIIAVVQNRKKEAMAAARKAIQSNPQSATAYMALSYAHQAAFNLSEALNAGRTAVAQAPENGTTHARLAELHLSMGQLDQAIEAAQKATVLNPNTANAHNILGFAYLTQVKTHEAQAAFEQAILLDSAAPLPRLGLGLAIIRQGDLKAGRAQIEIAAGLDPLNAVVRSYLGKSYFDEKRGPLDRQQLDIAKALDPNDPTAWFYDAIRKQSLNRPGEALRDLKKSMALNDNRAVYRSRLMLDEDLAARSAGLGRIYNDLSFQEQALREGYKSLHAEPANYSAHRLLADIYASRSRHEIARVSELLQAQLLQPLNLTPVQPQLAESDLMIQEGAGPAELAFNEYNPLFARDRVTLQASGVTGENNTQGHEVTIAGLYQRFSLSVGQMHYKTDGFRENNELEQDIANGFAQVALSPKSSLQVEYRSKKTSNGDLRYFFDPESFSPIYDEERKEHTPRIGFRFSPKVNHHFLLSAIANDVEFTRKSETVEGENVFGPIVSSIDQDETADAYNIEAQYIYQSRPLHMILGAGYYDDDGEGTQAIKITNGPFTLLDTTTDSDADIEHTNVYVYSQLFPFSKLALTLGMSLDDYDDGTIDSQQFNPKIGVTWLCTPQLTLRAAGFRTLKRSLVANQTLEPTHVAGFNQFFDDFSSSDGTRYGVGFDYEMNANVVLGGELSFRQLTVPKGNSNTSEITENDFDEQLHRLYLNWLPIKQIAVSLQYLYEQYSQESGEPDLTIPDELTTQQLPLTLSFFHPSGLFVKLRGRYVRQEIRTYINSTTKNEDQDEFGLCDAEIGWRLPKKFGMVSLSATNLFDREFNFYGVDYYRSTQPLSPEIRPERQILLKATFSF